MKQPGQWFTLIIFFVLHCFTPGLQAESLIVPGEIFRAPAGKKAAPQLKLKALSPGQRGAVQPMSVDLGAPDAAELEALNNQNQQRKAFQVGIRRQVPTLPAVADWIWTPVPGGQAGQFILTSAQAHRIRTRLILEAALPAGVEIRFFSPANKSIIHGPYTQADFTSINRGTGVRSLWTPSVAGSALGIEIFAPHNADIETIRLKIPLISHILLNPEAGTLKNTQSLLSTCAISIACATEDWQDVARAVARYIYTDQQGDSYYCTGTLITDQDQSSQIPYFLTAAHCVNDQRTAATMDFFWRYRESSCGANDATWVQVSGGAQLLRSVANLDGALVRLNHAPPAGVMMSGWMLDPLEKADPVYGIHHGGGNIKQFTQGSMLNRVNLVLNGDSYLVRPDPQGNFVRASWDLGITLAGSSGSGVWTTRNDLQLLKGTLVGGSSTCANPAAPDEYSRLELFYPYIENWLGKRPLSSLLNPGNSPQALTDGVVLVRYMNGIRGQALLKNLSLGQTIAIARLEEQLAEVSPQLDIDGNGQIEGPVDGLLLTRYLLGLRGNSLIADIDLAEAPRRTASAVSNYLLSVLEKD